MRAHSLGSRTPSCQIRVLIFSPLLFSFAVNKGFDDLIELLVEIDPVVKAEHEDRVRRGAAEEHLLSRVELIGRTVDVLRRVHRENEERKLIVQQLLQSTAKPTAPPPSKPIPVEKVSCASACLSFFCALQ